MTDAPAIERLSLPAIGDLDAAGELKSALLALLATRHSAQLDASEVAEPSIALIQTIETAAETFAAAGLEVRLADPSDALCAAYEDAGLFGALMSRIAQPG
jgi:hypothetical protein